MKNIISAVFLALVFTSSHASGSSGNINFFIGTKSLEKSDWEPVDEHAELGVLVDFKAPDWPVSFAIDFLVSGAKESQLGLDIEGRTSEIDIGVRKIFDDHNSSVRPYIGGGLALISAEIEATNFSISDDDRSLGIWLNGGVYWTLNQSFNIGIDLRYSKAEVTLFNVDGEAGGTHIGLMLGYHW